MGFVSEAQKEALFRNRDLYNQKRKSGEIVQDRSKVSKKQREASSKNMKKFNKKRSAKSQIKEVKIVKALLKHDTIKEAAKEVGVSQTHAARLLNNVRQNGTLREAFSELGWDAAGLAKEVREFKDYNSDKVIRVVGEGMSAREIEEMRDASNSFKALKLASDHISATANALANSQAAIDVDDNTALLAIKSLIQKLDETKLRIVRDSIDALLEKSLKVVAS